MQNYIRFWSGTTVCDSCACPSLCSCAHCVSCTLYKLTLLEHTCAVMTKHMKFHWVRPWFYLVSRELFILHSYSSSAPVEEVAFICMAGGRGRLYFFLKLKPLAVVSDSNLVFESIFVMLIGLNGIPTQQHGRTDFNLSSEAVANLLKI